MQKVKLIVENTFAESTSNNNEIGISVFDRVFSKLKSGKGSLGKIHPIYIKYGDKVKIIGVLTMNTSGSYSFFPELPGKPEFDHLTFNKDLSKDKHHFTRVTDGIRQKILPITGEYLNNDTYHVFTIIIREHSLLKAAPKEILYPEVDISQIQELKKAFMTSEGFLGSSLLKVDNDNGSLCLQLFLVPNTTDYEKLTVFIKPLKMAQPDFELEEGTDLSHIIIPHEYQKDFSLGISAFNYNKSIDQSLQMITGAKQKGFYSKIHIKKK